MTAQPSSPRPRGRTATGEVPDPEAIRQMLREWMEEPEEDPEAWEAFQRAMNENKPLRPPYPELLDDRRS